MLPYECNAIMQVTSGIKLGRGWHKYTENQWCHGIEERLGLSGAESNPRIMDDADTGISVLKGLQLTRVFFWLFGIGVAQW